MYKLMRNLGSSIKNIYSKKAEGYFTRKDVPAMLALGIGIMLSLLTFILMERLEFKDVQNEFMDDTENYAVALKKSIDGNLNSLHAVEGLYGSSAKITRSKFHAFGNSILSHSDGIHALRWVPRVIDVERKSYEAAAIRDGFSTYRFTERAQGGRLVTAARRPEYFPIYFSEPAGENEAVLGLDVSAKPVGKASLEKARDTGAPVATRRITLSLESDPQFAFLVFQPIYRNAVPHETVAQRRRNLIGFAMGVFRMGDMVNAALRGINLNGIELTLTDESATPERKKLYSNVRESSSAAEVLTFTKNLNVADRIWTVKFYSTPGYLAARNKRYSWAVLATGLVSTVLLALYVLNMKRHAFEMEQSKDTITTVLNSINAAIAIVDSKNMSIVACNQVFLRATEFNHAEIIGRRCDEIAHKKSLPCNGACAECPVTLVMGTGENAIRETIHLGADKEERYIEMSAFPIRNNMGSVTQVVHVARDITKRKQAENSRLEEQEMRRMSAEQRVVETQLRMLQAQIEPHFLFNTLANVVSLIDKHPQSAKDMLGHLTGSLRRSLQRTRADISTLAQEAEILEDYLGIYKMRLGQRLNFTIDIPQELLELPFPPMLLQPLVENAIIHGIEPKLEGGCITIKAEKSDGLLRLSVSDTGLGFSELVKSQGLGLENVEARLQALYRVGAGLTLKENVPCGATATIEVPL